MRLTSSGFSPVLFSPRASKIRASSLRVSAACGMSIALLLADAIYSRQHAARPLRGRGTAVLLKRWALWKRYWRGESAVPALHRSTDPLWLLVMCSAPLPGWATATGFDGRHAGASTGLPTAATTAPASPCPRGRPGGGPRRPRTGAGSRRPSPPLPQGPGRGPNRPQAGHRPATELDGIRPGRNWTGWTAIGRDLANLPRPTLTDMTVHSD
eukprot:COSAG01_NODE_5907_length_3960_cov_4.258482_2_plen_212_part_00